MKTIYQTDFSGIDGLALAEIARPIVPVNGILIKMTMLPVVPSDWKRELDPHATAEAAAKLPRTIGIGGVGRVVEVGEQQDQALMNRRVLIMNPKGSYSEYVVMTQREFVFPLPDAVSDEQAAALTAGPGTALTLVQAIHERAVNNVVITGANSVIGLVLLQQLSDFSGHIWPIVSSASQAYFRQQRPTDVCYTVTSLPVLTETTVVIDLAGSEELLQRLRTWMPAVPVISIALTESDVIDNLTFVHEEFNAAGYRQFICQIAAHELVIPVDRQFLFTQVKEAQRYAKMSHSRGRVLVTLTSKETIND
ncbi:alcohol dehydrogenase catalytic domain-containing protein [Furfurilactobacillus siliginis]|uniref:NADPH quinone reductase or related Zn-dependent oxidoreductase n=1 Tax=Furfurilactobacillus siliginis TaxID=348151 RepID=A0A0R2L656_9LACO|nr:hypothetical protein [Furfurilactobacillus siliginis]KRN97273.1 NADPH quinone reductase or related Zn-dependent oxidoreductase [Furfurilactobacillus siliginis]GEK28584.1 hypothetical protein LSI01_08950 [Furfurilactobacillus siliginis]